MKFNNTGFWSKIISSDLRLDSRKYILILISTHPKFVTYYRWFWSVVANAFIHIPMAHHAHKLSNITLEEKTFELLCMEFLFIPDNADFFSLDIEEISFPLAYQIVEVEHNLELQAELSTNIRTDINKSNSDWK